MCIQVCKLPPQNGAATVGQAVFLYILNMFLFRDREHDDVRSSCVYSAWCFTSYEPHAPSGWQGRDYKHLRWGVWLEKRQPHSTPVIELGCDEWFSWPSIQHSAPQLDICALGRSTFLNERTLLGKYSHIHNVAEPPPLNWKWSNFTFAYILSR